MARGTSNHVEAFFRSQPNELVTVERVAADTGLTRVQVTHAVNTLRGHGMNIGSFGRGKYRFDTTAPPVVVEKPVEKVSCMEVIAITKAGKLVCKGDDGVLYVAQEADF